jgi:hypothetical protein
MLQIDKTIVSLDILEEKFCCDLGKCQGACCIEGDSGAPVTPEEASAIKQSFLQFESYLSERNREEIKKQGFSIIDKDGDLVTPLVGNNECVYTFVDEQGNTKCAIERAYLEGKITFRKPVSCHLFPIRITEYKRFDALNYQQLDICRSARICGKKGSIPLWQYLKEPLIRKYGQGWYDELETAAKVYAEKDPEK